MNIREAPKFQKQKRSIKKTIKQRSGFAVVLRLQAGEAF